MLKKLLVFALLVGSGLLILFQTSHDSSFERHRSQLLKQPSERVWQLLANVDGWQRWWPGVEKVKLLGPLQVGSQIDLRLKGVPEEHPVELVRLNPGRGLVWQRDGVLGSVAETAVWVKPQASGSLLSISTRIIGPQARLAEFSNAESFAQYQELFLKSIELFLQEEALSQAAKKD